MDEKTLKIRAQVDAVVHEQAKRIEAMELILKLRDVLRNWHPELDTKLRHHTFALWPEVLFKGTLPSTMSNEYLAKLNRARRLASKPQVKRPASSEPMARARAGVENYLIEHRTLPGEDWQLTTDREIAAVLGTTQRSISARRADLKSPEKARARKSSVRKIRVRRQRAPSRVRQPRK